MTEQAPSRELELNPEILLPALEEMITEGVGSVQLLTESECNGILDKLDMSDFVTLFPDFQPVQGRQKYLHSKYQLPPPPPRMGETVSPSWPFGPVGSAQDASLPGTEPEDKVLAPSPPEELWQLRGTVKAAFDMFAVEHPEFTRWSELAGSEQELKKGSLELTRYPPGVDVDRHIDDADNNVWPSQVFITLKGEGTFYVYDRDNPDIVKREVAIKPGVVILLEGDEIAGHSQLEHSVTHTSERILYAISADREAYLEATHPELLNREIQAEQARIFGLPS